MLFTCWGETGKFLHIVECRGMQYCIKGPATVLYVLATAIGRVPHSIPDVHTLFVIAMGMWRKAQFFIRSSIIVDEFYMTPHSAWFQLQSEAYGQIYGTQN